MNTTQLPARTKSKWALARLRHVVLAKTLARDRNAVYDYDNIRLHEERVGQKSSRIQPPQVSAAS
jgi:hypothetical protein